ncbi:MAG: hypothetical protein ACKOPT_17085 [Cyanobium sp.]
MISGAALSGSELFWLLALLVVFAVDFLTFLSSRDPLGVYQPPVFVMAFMSYYTLVGPIQRVIENSWIHITIDFRYAAVYGWAGAVVFYLSLRLGYGAFRHWRPHRRFAPAFDHLLAARLGGRLCWLGILLFSLVNGLRVIAYLNPLNVTGSQFFAVGGFNLGLFTTYANQAINLLIPGVLLQFTSWVRSGRPVLSWILWSLATLSIFTSLGFRWRIVTLIVPMVLLWFLARGRRPATTAIGLSTLGLVVIAGLIEQTRSYGAGLSFDRAPTLSLQGLLDTGLNESTVFLTTGGIIANSPTGFPFVGLQPFISTILFPVPRALWQGKDSFQYLLDATAALYQSDTLGLGQASLNYAEYYLMFGWLSVVLMGLLSGWLLRSLWNWFSPRRHETLAQVTYLCTCGLLYMWVSRGYMPQVVTTFAFGSAPLFWLYYRTARRLRPPTPSIPTVELGPTAIISNNPTL